MNYYSFWDKKLIRQQLDQKLQKLRDLLAFPAENGWIRVLREALGMSTTQLAKRIGVDQSRISRIEKSELTGEIKLSTMKKVAEGLNMKFVYGFVPVENLEAMITNQARKIALKRMENLNHTMRLEDQELSDPDKQKALADLVQRILTEQGNDFWDQ